MGTGSCIRLGPVSNYKAANRLYGVRVFNMGYPVQELFMINARGDDSKGPIDQTATPT